VAGRAIERDRLSKDRSVALEALPPERLANENDMLTTWTILVGAEVIHGLAMD